MIGYLKGTIINCENGVTTINVNDVGWEVHTGNLQMETGSTTEIFVFTYVRESSVDLWGFLHKHDLDLFKTLLNISGVGGRTAQSLVQVIGRQTIVEAVKTKDPKMIKSPGVGPKTAQKIVLELQDKLANIDINLTSKQAEESVPEHENKKDAFDALESLGYSYPEIVRAYAKIPIDDLKNSNSQDLIKHILKLIK